jgi:predicted nucleic acid-binding protein
VRTANSFLLDTSAIFAFLEDEAGADRVEEVLQNEQVYLTWTTLLEVFYISLRERGRKEAATRFATLHELPVLLLKEIDEPLLMVAGELKAHHRISFADAMIAAYAIRHEAVLIHKDPELHSLAGQVFLEALLLRRSDSA